MATARSPQGNFFARFSLASPVPPPPMPQTSPLQFVLDGYESLAKSLQIHLSHLFPLQRSPHNLAATASSSPPVVLASRSTDSSTASLSPQQSYAAPGTVPTSVEEKTTVPLSKEVLGRATWTLLHAIAAQFPDQPTRQQKRDVKELMAIISRVYPCKECSHHFREILKANPVQAGSHAEFSQWLCHMHNIVNRSLGKATFPCQRVDARWGKLDCPERECDVDGTPDL